jgi:hypothetical protein
MTIQSFYGFQRIPFSKDIPQAISSSLRAITNYAPASPI